MTLMLLLKSTLLWSVLLLGARALRSAHPGDRHRLWTIGFAALLALPILAAAVPALDVPVESSWALSAKPASDGVSSVAAPTVSDRVPELPEPATAAIHRNLTQAMDSAPVSRPVERPSLTAMAIGVWSFGAFVAAVGLVLSLLRVWRLRLTAREMTDSVWHQSAQATASRLGMRRRVRLLVHDRVRVPMAGGVWQPVVYLPGAAEQWTAERRDVVLAHELAHLAGRDPLRLIAARVTVALYWFHPLAWIAARQSGADLEEACDAAVLALGTRPSAYATLLLEFADGIRTSAPLAALPIVQRSLLEKRLMAILRDERHALTRIRLFLPALVGVIATISIAAAQPVGRTPASAVQVQPAASSSTMHAAVPASPPRMVAAESHAARAHHGGTTVAAAQECWSDDLRGRSFNGSMSMNGRDITEEIGTRDGDRVIEESLDGIRLCMIADDVGSSIGRDERPSEWVARAPRIVIESQQSGQTARLTLTRQAGAQQVSWSVNGVERTFDAAAAQWRDRMLAVLDDIWQLSTLRGDVSTLRGEISTVYGQESTLQGRISTLRGEVSTMRGEQSTIRGQESSLQGEISSIRGHVSSLRGDISSEEGAISSIEARPDPDRDAAAIARHRDEIARIERELRDYDEQGKVAAVEQRIKDLDVDHKVAAIDAQIAAFDLAGKIAAVDNEIEGLDVQGQVARIQQQIAALDADRRERQFEDQRDAALRQLEAALKAIK